MTNAIVTYKSSEIEVSKSQTNAMQAIADMVLNTVSERSRRDYSRALQGFMSWYIESNQAELSKATVSAHVAHLKAQGVGEASINQRLAAIRKMMMECADNGLISESTAQAIKRVENIKIQGGKLGNWLTRDQASQMVNAPDTGTPKGLRDRAILAIMLGCGLRREEVVTLDASHLQQREGRWVILDLTGKHNRTRTIPMAAWVKAIIDKWMESAGITNGVLFRRIIKGGRLTDDGLTSQAVWNVVQEYSPVEGLAPHDLRRTFAKLADKAGAPLAQIQKTLGHASIQTTERYLGTDLNLENAPSDYVRLDIAK